MTIGPFQINGENKTVVGLYYTELELVWLLWLLEYNNNNYLKKSFG